MRAAAEWQGAWSRDGSVGERLLSSITMSDGVSLSAMMWAL